MISQTNKQTIGLLFLYLPLMDLLQPLSFFQERLTLSFAYYRDQKWGIYGHPSHESCNWISWLNHFEGKNNCRLIKLCYRYAYFMKTSGDGDGDHFYVDDRKCCENWMQNQSGDGDCVLYSFRDYDDHKTLLSIHCILSERSIVLCTNGAVFIRNEYSPTGFIRASFNGVDRIWMGYNQVIGIRIPNSRGNEAYYYYYIQENDNHHHHGITQKDNWRCLMTREHIQTAYSLGIFSSKGNKSTPMSMPIPVMDDLVEYQLSESCLLLLFYTLKSEPRKIFRFHLQSRKIREIQIPNSSIQSIHLCKITPMNLFVTTSDGNLYLWDYGTRILFLFQMDTRGFKPING
jgi:hypothetical protein